MKAQKSKHRIVALLLAVIIMIGSVPMTATAAAAPERSYQEKEVTAYLLSMEKTEPVKCLFYDDMPSIPYIGVMDYLEMLCLYGQGRDAEAARKAKDLAAGCPDKAIKAEATLWLAKFFYNAKSWDDSRDMFAAYATNMAQVRWPGGCSTTGRPGLPCSP